MLLTLLVDHEAWKISRCRDQACAFCADVLLFHSPYISTYISLVDITSCQCVIELCGMRVAVSVSGLLNVAT